MLKINVDNRASVEELINHPWIKQYENESALLLDWINNAENIFNNEQQSLKTINLNQIGVMRKTDL